MKNIVLLTLAKVENNSNLDTIKKVLKAECENANFEITEEDYNYMLTEVISALA